MTSDAKVGLLLGLAFIFIIAFLINGLPGLHQQEQTNVELADIVAKSTDSALGIDDEQLELINRSTQARNVPAPIRNLPASNSDTGRVRTEIPLAPVRLRQQPAEQLEQVATVQPTPQPERQQPEPVEPARARREGPIYYTVQPGETLSSIAVKFYGSEQGNKLKNIERIYRANRDVLKSPDQIYQGQKLVIPPLPDASTRTAGAPSILKHPLFEPVRSIGQVKLRTRRQSRIYVVQPGDSLWKIAEKTLGDGNRYKEIAKLNAEILDDEDSLKVGMRLKLPAR